MEKSIITTGKTFDAAVQAALEQLGMDRESVSVQLLENAKSGVFGIGARPYKVQVSYEVPDEPAPKAAPAPEAPAVPAAPKTALSSASRSKPKKAALAVEVPAAPVAPKAPAVPAAPKAPAAPAAEKAPAAPKAPRPAAPKAPREPREVREPKPYVEKTYAPAEPGSTEEKIEQFLKGLVEQMGSEAVPHAFAVEGGYKVEFTGKGLGALIGRRGETLDAIQHLTNYAVNRGLEQRIRITVDAEDYRLKREESLDRYAKKKAQQVLKLRRRTTLEPMNAYERHVIHASLQDMENITTYSTGTEPNRRVVIEYVR